MCRPFYCVFPQCLQSSPVLPSPLPPPPMTVRWQRCHLGPSCFVMVWSQVWSSVAVHPGAALSSRLPWQRFPGRAGTSPARRRSRPASGRLMSRRRAGGLRLRLACCPTCRGHGRSIGRSGNDPDCRGRCRLAGLRGSLRPFVGAIRWCVRSRRHLRTTGVCSFCLCSEVGELLSLKWFVLPFRFRRVVGGWPCRILAVSWWRSRA